MSASDDFLAICLDERFPLKDVEAIATRIAASNAFVAGYIPPSVGMLSVAAIKFEKLTGYSFVLLPDRNIVSRMSRVGRDTERQPFDKTAQLATDIMAFAQALDIEIEPSIAFHELAHQSGNTIANQELTYFRGADRSQAEGWIELAMGRIPRLPSFQAGAHSDFDLAQPLNRWRRNYLVALKIGELELADMDPRQRASMLLEWMERDYFIAGPGLMYGLMYLGPNARKADLFKQLRSPSRDRAIAGIKNAAWDMTYLSDFTKKVQDSVKTQPSRRYIFTSGDERLAAIARVLFSIVGEQSTLQGDIEVALRAWWPRKEAADLAQLTYRKLTLAGSRPPPRYKGESDDPIRDWTIESENRILHWKPV